MAHNGFLCSVLLLVILGLKLAKSVDNVHQQSFASNLQEAEILTIRVVQTDPVYCINVEKQGRLVQRLCGNQVEMMVEEIKKRASTSLAMLDRSPNTRATDHHGRAKRQVEDGPCYEIIRYDGETSVHNSLCGPGAEEYITKYLAQRGMLKTTATMPNTTPPAVESTDTASPSSTPEVQLPVEENSLFSDSGRPAVLDTSKKASSTDHYGRAKRQVKDEPCYDIIRYDGETSVQRNSLCGPEVEEFITKYLAPHFKPINKPKTSHSIPLAPSSTPQVQPPSNYGTKSFSDHNNKPVEENSSFGGQTTRIGETPGTPPKSTINSHQNNQEEENTPNVIAPPKFPGYVPISPSSGHVILHHLPLQFNCNLTSLVGAQLSHTPVAIPIPVYVSREPPPQVPSTTSWPSGEDPSTSFSIYPVEKTTAKPAEPHTQISAPRKDYGGIESEGRQLNQSEQMIPLDDIKEFVARLTRYMNIKMPGWDNRNTTTTGHYPDDDILPDYGAPKPHDSGSKEVVTDRSPAQTGEKIWENHEKSNQGSSSREQNLHPHKSGSFKIPVQPSKKIRPPGSGSLETGPSVMW